MQKLMIAMRLAVEFGDDFLALAGLLWILNTTYELSEIAGDYLLGGYLLLFAVFYAKNNRKR